MDLSIKKKRKKKQLFVVRIKILITLQYVQSTQQNYFIRAMLDAIHSEHLNTAFESEIFNEGK